jgi:hypothetical protein
MWKNCFPTEWTAKGSHWSSCICRHTNWGHGACFFSVLTISNFEKWNASKMVNISDFCPKNSKNSDLTFNLRNSFTNANFIPNKKKHLYFKERENKSGSWTQ